MPEVDLEILSAQQQPAAEQHYSDGVAEKQYGLHGRTGHEQRHGEQRIETVSHTRNDTRRITDQRLFAKFHRLSKRIAN